MEGHESNSAISGEGQICCGGMLRGEVGVPESGSVDRLFAAHILRRLVVAQGYEFRVAQMVHVRPVCVLYLRDQLRLQPAAFGHLLGRQPAFVALRQI
jgi:hypothetical protein